MKVDNIKSLNKKSGQEMEERENRKGRKDKGERQKNETKVSCMLGGVPAALGKLYLQ